MARRYAIHLPPVQHMNGKLAPSSWICHDQPDSSVSEVTYYYGYRHANRPDISRYALREKARDLSVHPYTADETAHRDLFAECVDVARQLLHDPIDRAKISAAFRAQRYYSRVYNYTIAKLVQNGGTPPPDWHIN